MHYDHYLYATLFKLYLINLIMQHLRSLHVYNQSTSRKKLCSCLTLAEVRAAPSQNTSSRRHHLKKASLPAPDGFYKHCFAAGAGLFYDKKTLDSKILPLLPPHFNGILILASTCKSQPGSDIELQACNKQLEKNGTSPLGISRGCPLPPREAPSQTPGSSLSAYSGNAGTQVSDAGGFQS